MGLSNLDSSPDAKLGGTFKVITRRDNPEALAPRITDEATSDSQTSPPVLCLQRAGKAEHVVADCQSGSDNMPDLSDISDSSVDSSEGGRENKEVCEAFGVICPRVVSAHHRQISIPSIPYHLYKTALL